MSWRSRGILGETLGDGGWSSDPALVRGLVLLHEAVHFAPGVSDYAYGAAEAAEYVRQKRSGLFAGSGGTALDNADNYVQGDAIDPRGLVALERRYLSWLQVAGASRHTINTRRNQLNRFVAWCGEHDVTNVAAISRAHIDAYQRHLFHYRQKSGQALSHRTQSGLLIAVVVWLRWLTKQHEILANPAADLELPRKDKTLPRSGFNVSEVEEVLNAIDTDSMLGLRDRAIFEMLYSTALRRSELCGVLLYDVDRARGTVFVRAGKGGQDRVVPIGRRALAWLDKYLVEVRPHLLKGGHEPALWLTMRGTPLRPNTLTMRASELVRSVKPERRRAACHVFRHTAATLMLEGGADVRVLQELLGHRHLDSTQVYTRVSVQHLKDVHEKTHPAKLELTAKDEDGDELELTAKNEDGDEE